MKASRSELEDALYSAIAYVLTRAQRDPELRHHMLLTEGHDRLMAAEAAYLGEDLDTVAARRKLNESPHARPRCAEDAERVDELEAEVARLQRAGREW